jgi:hypothetical protein
MRSFLLVLSVLLVVCVTAQAQYGEEKRTPMEIYAQASAVGQGALSSNGPSQGFRVGAAWTPLPRYGLVGDFSYYRNAGNDLTTFMAGPRYSTVERYRTSWFGQALFGGARTSLSSGHAGFATAWGGGLDIRLTDRVVFRAFEAEFLGTIVPATARISSGVVVRLGPK